MEPLIVARQLGKSYKSGKVITTALRDASFSVDRGEFVAVVGPSGSGKSTLFYLLGGLTRASGGQVTIDGIDFSQLSDAERTRERGRRIGFVFQRFNLLPTLTARDNILLAFELSGTSREADPAYLNQLAQLLRIEHRLNARPSELSGGEQQRVAIARAMIHRPALILADEPTGNLDSENSATVLEMLQQASREFGQTVLMITHDSEAAAIAGRTLYVRDGLLHTTPPPPRLPRV